MSENLHKTLRETLNENLKKNGFELVDLIEIPGGKLGELRVRTLEEIFKEFDLSNSTGTMVNYVIRAVRPEAALSFDLPPAMLAESPSIPERPMDAIYDQRGKLKIDYLEKQARVLLKSGEFALAKNVYTAILKSGERNADALYGIARCYDAMGDANRAQSHYEESIAYAPSPRAFHRLARLLIKQGKDDYAVETMERCLKSGELSTKERFELHKACGNRLTRMSRPEDAENHYRKALELDPVSDAVRSNLGTLYLQNGRITDARRAYQDAVASNPSNARAQFGLGICYLAESNKKSAHDCFTRTLEIDLMDSNAVYHLMKCAYELKCYGDAERLISEYVQRAPVNPSLLYGLAGLKFHMGKKTEAQVVAQRILQIKPNHSGAVELLKLIT